MSMYVYIQYDGTTYHFKYIFFFLDFMIENYLKESIFCSQIFGVLLCGLHFRKDFRLAPQSVSPNSCGRK